MAYTILGRQHSVPRFALAGSLQTHAPEAGARRPMHAHLCAASPPPLQGVHALLPGGDGAGAIPEHPNCTTLIANRSVYPTERWLGLCSPSCSRPWNAAVIPSHLVCQPRWHSNSIHNPSNTCNVFREHHSRTPYKQGEWDALIWWRTLWCKEYSLGGPAMAAQASCGCTPLTRRHCAAARGSYSSALSTHCPGPEGRAPPRKALTARFPGSPARCGGQAANQHSLCIRQCMPTHCTRASGCSGCPLTSASYTQQPACCASCPAHSWRPKPLFK